MRSRADARRLGWTAAGLGVAGAAALAAGAWLWLGDSHGRAAVGVDPAGARLAWEF